MRGEWEGGRESRGEIGRFISPPGERREIGRAVLPNPCFRTDDATGVGQPSAGSICDNVSKRPLEAQDPKIGPAGGGRGGEINDLVL